MFCTRCGENIPDDAVFCSHCGSRISQQPAGTSPVSLPQAPASPRQPEGQPAAGYSSQPALEYAPQPAAAPAKKKSNLPLILGTSLATIALIALVFLGIKFFGSGNEPGGQQEVTAPKQVEKETEKNTVKATEKETEKATEKPVSLKAGDIITFGSYPQEADGTVKPIEWQVLAVEDGKALIISLYGLDAKRYNEEYKDVTWETCTLRTWLNEDFYQMAFKASEQKRIAETLVINKDNPTFGTTGGNDTRDKIFLLSLEETLEYFGLTKNNGEYEIWVYCYGDEVCCRPTNYAVSQGAFKFTWSSSESEKHRKYDGNCEWWLRSPGYDSFFSAAYVNDVRAVSGYGTHVSADAIAGHTGSYYAVRPALWINP